MQSVFPKYLLGTQAFYTFMKGANEELSVWIRQNPLFENGIVVSTASLIQIYDEIEQNIQVPAMHSAARELQERFRTAYIHFAHHGCILPITENFVSFASSSLSEDIHWVSLNGHEKKLPFLEKIVISTALNGLYNVPLYLIDYEQPTAFSNLKQKFGLQPHPISRPAIFAERQAS